MTTYVDALAAGLPVKVAKRWPLVLLGLTANCENLGQLKLAQETTLASLDGAECIYLAADYLKYAEPADLDAAEAQAATLTDAQFWDCVHQEPGIVVHGADLFCNMLTHLFD
jgi:hypothetical protein